MTNIIKNVPKLILNPGQNAREVIRKVIKSNFTTQSLVKFVFQKFVLDMRYPMRTFIEPPNLCNERRKMCPKKESEKDISYIDNKLLNQIVDESAPFGKKVFNLFST